VTARATTSSPNREKAIQKIEKHIADALAKGARILVGGKRHSLGSSFFEPTLLAGVTDAMKVAGEETFEPAAPAWEDKRNGAGNRAFSSFRVRQPFPAVDGSGTRGLEMV